MSLHRFFLETQILSESDDGIVDVVLSGEDLRHMKATRITEGETVAIVDASSDYFQCQVVELTNTGFVARIASMSHIEKPSFSIDLFQGIPKAGKLEEIVRHGTEIGINAFYPFSCERSVVKLNDKKSETRRERLQRIAKSAAIQSGRNAIPEVNLPIDIKKLGQFLAIYDSLIVFWEEAALTSKLSESLEGPKTLIANDEYCSVAVVIGPEGGLSESEVDLLLGFNENAHMCTLGPNILRTETAGVVGCALISYELGGMGGYINFERADD